MSLLTVNFNDSQFTKDMKNITDYMIGFLDGAKAGKPNLLKNLGIVIKEILENFIDSNAKVDPASLSHVYEWYQSGSSDARLFDIIYVPSTRGLSFGFTLRQSTSVKQGSNVPFYDKARIMEEGIPVTIRPVNRQALKFDVNGETIFSSKPITISDPGGASAQGGLQNVFTQFFTQYVSQSLMDVSGLRQHFESAMEFKENFSSSKSGGKSLGYQVGIKWISGGIK
jgi:hypothetical protein